MKTKLATAICAALLTLVGFAAEAHAQQAPPPVGLWSGRIQGGGTLTVLITGGGMTYQVGGAQATTGTWTWNPTYSGGIITLHYYNAGRLVQAYYSITYINRNQVVFSDPYFKAVLNRR
jgi:hypothetical protein